MYLYIIHVPINIKRYISAYIHIYLYVHTYYIDTCTHYTNTFTHTTYINKANIHSQINIYKETNIITYIHTYINTYIL